MPHLIKRSLNKLIHCGKTLEFIEYEKPFFYNFPPKKKNLFSNLKKNDIIERRDDNIIKSRSRLRRLILSNTEVYKQKPLFITYTFAENIESPTEANIEWSNYQKRLNYFLFKRGLEKAKFITVIEFQKRGAVHYHTLYFNIPFIENIKIELSKIWGLGFIQVKSLENIENVAGYVSKYLQKGLIDKRLRNKKAFFGSRNLLRPLLFRDNNEVLLKKNKSNLFLIKTDNYESLKYGKIIYTVYKDMI